LRRGDEEQIEQNEDQIEQNEEADRGSGWKAAAWDRERWSELA
jgi:hypothetical protein